MLATLVACPGNANREIGVPGERKIPADYIPTRI
jgi:hypothetical protein